MDAFFSARASLVRGLGESCIEVAGLARLADRAAERFHIARALQLGQVVLMPLDLVFVTGDRPPRLFGLAAQLGKLLTQLRMIIGSSARSRSDLGLDRAPPDRPSSRRMRLAWCSESSR